MNDPIFEGYVADFFSKMQESGELADIIQDKVRTTSELLWDSLPIHGQLAVMVHTTSANYHPSYPLHSHDFFELIYIYRGKAVQHLESGTLELEEGSVCLMNTNYKHGLYIESNESIVFNILIARPLLNASFLNLISGNELFSGFFINSLFSTSEKGEYLYFEHNDQSRMEMLMQLLIEEYILRKPDYSAAMQSYLSLIFTELHRKHIFTSGVAGASDIDFPQILSYVSNNLENISIGSVAQHFHYDPSYLSKMLKQYLGRSFSSFLVDLKLEKAASFLENTSISIDSIVEVLGYYDRSYFNRVFRKKYGYSPSKYRELFGNAGHGVPEGS